MMGSLEAVPSRRAVLATGLKAGGLLAGTLMVPGAVSATMRDRGRAKARNAPESLIPTDFYRTPTPARVAAQPRVNNGVRDELMREAMAALDRHGSRIARHDRIAVADFSASSSRPRFHLINLGDGNASAKLVSHGSGSDPAHTGYLQRFSNRNGSNASCEGAFVTDNYYIGKHGKSQRLIGLDATNDNALDRAIVVHGAWYANPEMVAQRGVLGRSQGCFAVGERELAEVFERLGPGRMIYAAKV
jgi:hypothetical protein